MKRIITLFFLFLVFNITLYAQSNVIKKCKTCGKPIKECRYSGQHPQTTPVQQTSKPLIPQPVAEEGTIYITSTPSGAAVKIDGKYKGETPLTLEKQIPGNYTITISMEGYVSSTHAVTIAAGKRSDCNAKLTKKQVQHSASNNDSRTSNAAKTQDIVRMDGNDIVFTCDGTEYRYRMVYVSGGTYTMGCTSEQGWRCDEHEKPAHKVTVSGFYIGQTEVTQALWGVVMGNNPSAWKGYTLPVEKVSYNDVTVFIGKLNSITGKVFRLPTEEEWEFAARGGNNSRGYIFSGSDEASLVAWCDGNPPHSVKQKQPNELGLYDMSGNVNELCVNCWRRGFNAPDDCSKCVGRGGDSWLAAGDSDCNVSRRFGIDKSESDNVTIGFRLAL